MISIIIPAYNAEEYLEETVKSVLGQTYSNIEVIIVNDGSKDNTEKISLALVQQDQRVQYIYQNNAGVSIARNHGFEKSKGDYLAFLDADDVWLPQRLEKVIQRFEEDEAFGLVHTWMKVVDAETRETGEIYQGKEGHILNELLLWDGCGIPAPSSILVKREVVESVGGFDKELSTAADQEFFFRVAQKYKIGVVKEGLGLYRIHGNNMHQNITRMEKDHILAYRKAEENKLFQSNHFKRHCFSNLYLILAGSWWVNGNNKWRGSLFIMKSLVLYPQNFIKLLSKRA